MLLIKSLVRVRVKLSKYHLLAESLSRILFGDRVRLNLRREGTFEGVSSGSKGSRFDSPDGNVGDGLCGAAGGLGQDGRGGEERRADRRLSSGRHDLCSGFSKGLSGDPDFGIRSGGWWGAGGAEGAYGAEGGEIQPGSLYRRAGDAVFILPSRQGPGPGPFHPEPARGGGRNEVVRREARLHRQRGAIYFSL